VNQRDFDNDLLINFDDTGVLMPFPEQQQGFFDNPIRKLFERIDDEDGQEEQ
jgi:hypothetical protein